MTELETFDEKHLAIVAKLRTIAMQQMRKTGYSPQFHTLQRTEVANEVFEDSRVIDKFNNLFSRKDAEGEAADVEEFIKFCTIKIKHNLIDYMRKKFADKRGGNMQFVPLDDSLNIFSALDIKDHQIDHLNDVLEKLEKESEPHAKLVMNKYFLGMKNDEIAKMMDCSLSKIEKDNHFAIAWLRRELSQ